MDCVEYGSVENMPGALIVLIFNYHAVKTFFRDGTIHITLSGATTSIRSLAPNCSIWDFTAGTETTKSVSAGMQLGVTNYVEGNLGCAKEKQYKSIHYMHGSGEKTKRALWNAESGNRIGLPRQWWFKLMGCLSCAWTSEAPLDRWLVRANEGCD